MIGKLNAKQKNKKRANLKKFEPFQKSLIPADISELSINTVCKSQYTREMTKSWTKLEFCATSSK